MSPRHPFQLLPVWHNGPVNYRADIYVSGTSPVHKCDARAKIACLLAFSIAVLCASSWWGIAILAAVAVACVAVARLPLGRLKALMTGVYLLAAITALLAWWGNPTTEGLFAGFLVGVRMVLLVAGCFVVCFTTTSEELLAAFRSLLEPLCALHVPVDDIAFTLALSVRFIPQIGDELARIRAAQVSRGAQVEGSFVHRLRTWGVAFASLFVGLFRHADALSQAMDARCYGAATRRGVLAPCRTSGLFVAGTLAACMVLLAVGIVL